MKFNQNFCYAFLSAILFVFLVLSSSLLFIRNLTLLLLIKNFYGSICHQIENRCFFINEKPLFLCARCTGIFTGALIFLAILSLNKRLRNFFDKIPYKIILIFILPMSLDWIINFTFKIETTNFVRFLTGIIFSIMPVYFLNSLLINSKFE